MKDFFKTLWRPDREENPEKTLVAQASNILQVGEFQLLQLAYRDWHGEDLPESQSDLLFQAYMIRGDVPSWARHYARWVIRQDEIDMIDSRNPAFHSYDQNYVTHVPRGVRQFTFACMILASVFVVSLLVGNVAQIEATSVLPPYFESEEFGSAR